MKSFDFIEYLVEKAVRSELDAFDKEAIVRAAELMMENARKVVERFGYKARAASEVKYFADAVIRSAKMFDSYSPNSIRRMYDWWLTLEKEVEYGIEA